VLSDDSNGTEAFYPEANYGDGREEEKEDEFLTSEGEAEGNSTGLDDDDFQDPGDSHFAGLRGGLWSPQPVSRGDATSRRHLNQPRTDNASDHDSDRFRRPPRSGDSSPHGHSQGRRPGDPYYTESQQSESEDGRPSEVFETRTTTIPGRRTDRGPGVQVRRTRVAHAHRRPLGAHKGAWATRTRAVCGRKTRHTTGRACAA